MKKQGFSSIISILGSKEASPAELRQVTGLAKGTIGYHLDKLRDLNFVSKTKYGRYYLVIPSEFREIILENLIDGNTLDGLARILMEIAKKPRSNDTLKILCKVDSDTDKQKKPSKEFLEKLSDILKIFKSQGYIISGSSFYRGSAYQVTWKGCMVLNRCHVCKNKIDFQKKNFVMQSVEGIIEIPATFLDSGTSEWSEQYTPLIHVECIRHTSKLKLPKEAVCYHCGLPLSKKLLHDWYFGSSELNILLNLLTKEEVSNLHHMKDMMFIRQLEEKFPGIEFFSATISGNLESSVVRLDFDGILAEKLVNKFKEMQEEARRIRGRPTGVHTRGVSSRKESELWWTGIEGIPPSFVGALNALEFDYSQSSKDPDHKYFLIVNLKAVLSPKSFKVPNRSAVNNLLTLSAEGVINYASLKKISIDKIWPEPIGSHENVKVKQRLKELGVENAMDVFSLGEEGIGKLFKEPRIGHMVFVRIRNRLADNHPDFASFFDQINTRGKELFDEWQKEHLIRLEKFERAASDLSTGGRQLGASAYEMHSELASILPTPSYREDTSTIAFSGYSEETHGYSFIQTDVLGNRYHPLCYDIQFPDDTREPKEVYDGSESVVEPIKNEKEAKNIE